MRSAVITLFMLLAATAARGATTISQSWSTSVVIPDNSLTGWTNTQTITTSLTRIESVEVSLQISGGWNGDLYAYLVHGSGISILLNRVGVTSQYSAGSPVSGMNITLSDSAATDVHSASIFSGTFLPDARNVSPWSVTSATPRTATLANFIGLNPNGGWTLFVADTSPGSNSTVTGWGLTITGNNLAPIPEPASAAALGLPLLLAAGAFLSRRRIRESR